jgi:predicted nucleic acid-binding protein
MITALDSSVLWSIIRRESTAKLWLETLIASAAEGPLIISPIAFAELSPSTPDAPQLVEFLARLSISYEPISTASAHLAGSIFKQYRQAGGPRQHLVPDFLIAAHALCQADRLASTDRGYLRKWFPDLVVLTASDIPSPPEV